VEAMLAEVGEPSLVRDHVHRLAPLTRLLTVHSRSKPID
jgi:hypothetical protein